MEAGNKEVGNFLMSHSSKSLPDLLSSAWKMESSTVTVLRKATVPGWRLQESVQLRTVWIVAKGDGWSVQNRS